jgi:histidinol-phosphate aminotransferase
MKFDLQDILRDNIRNLAPYSTARDEFQGEASVYLDANESPFDTGINRYPDPLQNEVKVKISRIKNVHPHQIFLGNGSDEVIDVLMRAVCIPGSDNIVAIKPTYGMYKVCADINNIEYREVLLTTNFLFDPLKMLEHIDKNTKLVFLCSPNNPTANSLIREDIIHVLNNFNGIVVLDEAYIDYSVQDSFLSTLNNYPNLVVMQTFSKAWGMAGVRLGMAFASQEIINVMNKIKYPYNVNVLTQKVALEMLDKVNEKNDHVTYILRERNRMVIELKKKPIITKVFQTDANFVLVKVDDAKGMYDALIENEIIVRDRSKVALCEGCLRITIGTIDENNILLAAIDKFSNS